jgi:hypothetical protein
MEAGADLFSTGDPGEVSDDAGRDGPVVLDMSRSSTCSCRLDALRCSCLVFRNARRIGCSIHCLLKSHTSADNPPVAIRVGYIHGAW